MRGELIADLRPHRLFSVTVQAAGQWANDALLNLEEFSIGNFSYGRGYDPGANGGDRVYAFRVETHVKVPIGLPVDIELTGFFDYVKLYNLDAGSTENDRALRSVGGGVRLFRSRFFVLDASMRIPLDRALGDGLRQAAQPLPHFAHDPALPVEEALMSAADRLRPSRLRRVLLGGSALAGCAFAAAPALTQTLPVPAAANPLITTNVPAPR